MQWQLTLNDQDFASNYFIGKKGKQKQSMQFSQELWSLCPASFDENANTKESKENYL